MIVKNESHVIRRCLLSVLPFIDSYSISDTGSTDDTRAIILEVLHGVPGVLSRDAWQDFGTNRNLSLARADADHVLFIDADETLEVDSTKIELPGVFDGYVAAIHCAGAVFWRTAIIRNDARWKWHGKIHEVLRYDGNANGFQLGNVRIRSFNDSHRNKLGDKFSRDLTILEAEPRTASNLFYTAECLRGLNRYEESIAKYEEFAAIGEVPEEVYTALLNAADLRSLLPGSFESKAAAYFRAFVFRPERTEALSALCKILRENMRYEEAFRLSDVEPQVTQDYHYRDSGHAWRVLEEHALAAYFLNRFDEAHRYFLRVNCFELDPADRQRTISNIAFCISKLGK